jgi:hypothetical protein
VADLAVVPLSGRISADLLHEEEVDVSAENAAASILDSGGCYDTDCAGCGGFTM